jgi:uncharacterized protein (TIGR03000 family)
MSTVLVRTRLGLALVVLLSAGAAPGQADDKAGRPAKQPATIEVIVPDTKVEVKIGGSVARQTGRSRTFTTPPLEPGKTYHYRVEATIAPNVYTTIIRTREVALKAGERITVDVRSPKAEPGDDVRISWFRTPRPVAIKMGELARIGTDDVVYDLGCGDGIMIITAVTTMGARKGVGIDIDPKMVAKARANAEKAGVKDKIEIRKGNILKLDPKDVADATVVMLYLGDELHRQLRPYLWRALKPGTRIVSHRFLMDDWKPEKTITVTWVGDEYTLHLWTITGQEKAGRYARMNVQ